MTEFAEVAVGELFRPTNGRARFIRDYMDEHTGEFPVYSASLTRPFGFVDEFEYEGHYLTWVMNGYGGRVQEVSGRFSANRDRGVFVPLDGVRIPDLTYLRFALEPQLSAAAVGRRVDGRLNEYTKVYPDAAKEVLVRLPLNDQGQFDFDRMAELGDSLRRVEAAQLDVRLSQDALKRAAFSIEVAEPAATVSLNDKAAFALSIGERVLKSAHWKEGIPAYSANVLVPFGNVATSNISDFRKPSLLWGIDGIFDWNIIPEDQPFAHTDHCGRLQVLNPKINPNYVYWFLKLTRKQYGFDRVYRSSLTNMKADVTVTIPLDADGRFSLDRQQELAVGLRERERARTEALSALDEILKVRIATDA